MRPHLNDDLQIVTLSATLIRVPPIELWPRIVMHGSVPADIELALLSELAKDAVEKGHDGGHGATDRE
jgi:hypothetical protein